jgi:hypothetical protein
VAKVFSVHEIDIAPDVSEEAFRTFTDRLAQQYRIKGQTVYLLHGDRGVRVGKYAILVEFDSEERRDSYFPPPAFEATPEFLEQLGAAAPLFAQLEQYIAGFNEHFTDYVVAGPVAGE